MQEATREYLDTIGMRDRFVRTFETKFVEMGQQVSEIMQAPEVAEVYSEITKLVDYEGIIEELGEAFESLLSQDEIREITRLHKESPALQKLNLVSDDMLDLANKIGEKYIQRAVMNIGSFVQGTEALN